MNNSMLDVYMDKNKLSRKMIRWAVFSMESYMLKGAKCSLPEMRNHVDTRRVQPSHCKTLSTCSINLKMFFCLNFDVWCVGHINYRTLTSLLLSGINVLCILLSSLCVEMTEAFSAKTEQIHKADITHKEI